MTDDTPETLIAGALLAKRHTQAVLEDSQRLAVLAGIFTEEWPRQAPLGAVSLVFACMYRYDRQRIGGVHWAVLARRLVEAELAPGGPYGDTPERLLATNVYVGVLFELLRQPLPKVRTFVVRYLEAHPHRPPEPLVRSMLRLMPGVMSSGANRRPPPYGHRIPKVTADATPHGRVYEAVRREQAKLREPMRSQARRLIRRIRDADKNHEIALLARYFNDTLVKPVADDRTLTRLGRANVYCWAAYTAFDAAVDEGADLTLIPVANYCMRRSYDLYRASFSRHNPLGGRVVRAFDEMDQANDWEAHTCRLRTHEASVLVPPLPDYGDLSVLSRRSFGHVLGPVAVAGGIPGISAKQLQLIQDGFAHYLIARQLSDDVHDWQEDAMNGQISFVVGRLLERLHAGPGTYGQADLLRRMRQEFWAYVMDDMNGRILHEVSRSRELFAASGCLKADGPLFGLHDALYRAVHASRKEQLRYQAFLKGFITVASPMPRKARR